MRVIKANFFHSFTQRTKVTPFIYSANLQYENEKVKNKSNSLFEEHIELEEVRLKLIKKFL